jgi:hypothetical protein
MFALPVLHQPSAGKRELKYFPACERRLGALTPEEWHTVRERLAPLKIETPPPPVFVPHAIPDATQK